jgi:hypothetical protein
MLIAMTLLLALSPTIPASAGLRQTDPPIKLKLSDNVLLPGEHARVRVKTAEDGYLLVLRVDGEGRVRVLYPIDPLDSGRIRGGHEFEVRGRGDREAFTVDEREGSGTVLAAVSAQPFRFEEYSRGGHWDYRALSAEPVGSDGEASLLDLVDSLSAGHYDYDVVTYTVTSGVRARNYAGYYGPFYDPWYHPFYPFYGSGFRFGFGFGFGGRRFRGHRRW